MKRGVFCIIALTVALITGLCTSSGLAAVSDGPDPTIMNGADAESRFVTVAVPNLAGKWGGAWYDVSGGGWGALTLAVAQKGAVASGSMNVTDTDCGNVYGVKFTGTIVNNVITFAIKTRCNNTNIVMKFTKGIISKNGRQIKGVYTIYADGAYYDTGTFVLNKK